jgi:hypothetical protein
LIPTELDTQRVPANNSPLANFPIREADDEQDDREREAYHAEFTEMMRAPMMRQNVPGWSPSLLEMRPPTASDFEDSDGASVASLGSTTPAGFDGIMLAPLGGGSPQLHEPASMLYGGATVDKLSAHSVSPNFLVGSTYPLLHNAP